jgi:hypothetical protein
MLEIEVVLQNFGPPQTSLQNGPRIVNFSHLELIKSAITVGHGGWRRVFRYRKFSVFDTLRRVFTIKTALCAVNQRIHATQIYLDADPSDKGQISYCIGNIICALLAMKIAQVPWLMSLKVYESHLQPHYLSGTNERPDFVGQTLIGNWFVFEAKGRTTTQLTGTLSEAKTQTTKITGIRGSAVHCGLASIAYVGNDNQLRAIWDDPPAKPGSDGEDLELSEQAYFEGYYAPIHALLEITPSKVDSTYGPVVYLPTIDVFFGLENSVANALRLHHFDDVRDFAQRHSKLQLGNEPDTQHELLSPDGVIVRTGISWSGVFEDVNKRVRS